MIPMTMAMPAPMMIGQDQSGNQPEPPLLPPPGGSITTRRIEVNSAPPGIVTMNAMS